MLSTLIFYLFATFLVASAVMVIAARNPVHAVLFLILCFFNAGGLFILLGAEFVAFILLIVYVGAVAVLFLFVVMMLDINFRDLRQGSRRYMGIGLTVGAILLAELGFVAWVWPVDMAIPVSQAVATNIDNTHALGRVLYTDYIYPFQVAGLILLVAMIGAIVLTHRQRKTAKKQNVCTQLDRRPEDVLELRKVKTGEGAL